MNPLSRRLTKLETKMDKSSVPSWEELREACKITDRYSGLTMWKILCDVGIETEPPTLTDDDRAFLQECESGALDRAHDIQKRYRVGHGYKEVNLFGSPDRKGSD